MATWTLSGCPGSVGGVQEPLGCNIKLARRARQQNDNLAFGLMPSFPNRPDFSEFNSKGV